MACSSEPLATPGVHYFSMDKVMTYQPFCADFGPFNLGMTHHFCEVLKDLLRMPRMANGKIVYFTSTDPNDITNAMFLLGAFLIVHLKAMPEQAWSPFSDFTGVVLPYRDATWCKSPYDLTLLHCWQGLWRAVQGGLYSPDTFDEDEYFYYDHPENGDMHEVVTGKFFAFKGPTDKKQNYYTRRPSDYLDVFRVKGIKAVVRLNKKEYAASTFTDGGIAHHDLFFTDCSTPSDAIADRFLRLSERTDGPLAVHCLAGLGRTGTLIGLYMMKHMGFTANECMAWLRIVRPGSIIGPQQQYLKDMEKRMKALGRLGAVGMGLDGHSHGDLSAFDAALNGQAEARDAAAAVLAQQITQGMELRDKDKRSHLLHHGPHAAAAPSAAAPAHTTLPPVVKAPVRLSVSRVTQVSAASAHAAAPRGAWTPTRDAMGATRWAMSSRADGACYGEARQEHTHRLTPVKSLTPTPPPFTASSPRRTSPGAAPGAALIPTPPTTPPGRPSRSRDEARWGGKEAKSPAVSAPLVPRRAH